jgi:hypothetical protein
MGYFSDLLRGTQIADVYVDSEVTYIMLTNGTQITVRGVIAVEPAQGPVQCDPGPKDCAV